MDDLLKKVTAIEQSLEEASANDSTKNSFMGHIKISLRDYQVDGVNWVVARAKKGLGVILADEMGLGKTAQSIAAVTALMQQPSRGNAPFLVVAPLSVISNWAEEFERFNPAVRVMTLVGLKDERTAVQKTIIDFIKEQPKSDWGNPKLNFDVLITTYEIALSDEEFLKKFKFQMLIVDEAHRLKNSEAKLFQVLLSGYNFKSSLLLSGTPIQNNMDELWSMLHFIMPKLFDDKDMFVRHYRLVSQSSNPKLTPEERTEITKIVKNLHVIMRPFILRRTKDDVLLDLPPLTETIVFTGMSEMQKKYYKWVLTKDSKALSDNRNSLSNVLISLKKCCNHPYLFDGAEPLFDGEFKLGAHIFENSGKMVVLDKLLTKLHAEGEKVLIFSQMTRMLDIVQDYLDFRDFAYERLDGSIRGEDRFEAIKKFTKDREAFVFLLSTRAGGQGLNLTTARYVIFIDSDENPQRDLQAQARVHRIGQTKEVQVYRFVTKATVEEVILRRAYRKLALKYQVLDKGNFSSAENVPLIADALDDDQIDDLSEMIKFGLQELILDDSSTISDDPIEAILARAQVVKSSPSADTSAEGDNIYVFEGTDYTGEKKKTDEDALLKIRRDVGAETEKPKKAPPRVDSNGEPIAKPKKKEPAVVLSEEDRRLKRWQLHGYVSLQVALEDASDEDDDNVVQSLDPTARDFVHLLNGDASRPELEDGAKAVIGVAIDNSGTWSQRGFYRSIGNLADDIGEQYELAAKMKNLKLGDVHLIGVDEKISVALMICLERDDDYSPPALRIQHLQTCLAKAASVARKQKAGLHLPRVQDPTNKVSYYSIEHLLRGTVDRFKIHTYIYYYSRTGNLDVSGSLKRSLSVSDLDSTPAPKRQRTESQMPSPPQRENTFQIQREKSTASLPSAAASPSLNGVRFYLIGVGDDAGKLRDLIAAKGGAIDAKMVEGTKYIVTRKPRTDAMIALLVTKYPEAKVIAPEEVDSIVK